MKKRYYIFDKILNGAVLCLLAFPFLLNFVTHKARAQSFPIDLTTWTQEGDSLSGNWIVSPGGFSVLQNLSTPETPTFFISPDTFINVAFQGKVKVETAADDDYLGFLLGYQSPLAANGDPINRFDFLLFDWKQGTQGVAQEGFSLDRVNGRFNDFYQGFWAHTSSDSFQVLAADFGPGKGWEDSTEYDVEILYKTNRVRITIDSVTVFNITGAFPAGRFGFYTYSQPKVRFRDFSRKQILAAQNDSVTTLEDLPIIIPALANDLDPNGNLITLTGITQGNNGSTAINPGDSTVTYSPALDFYGTDTFTYSISNNNGSTDTASVFLTIHPVNDPPVISDSLPAKIWFDANSSDTLNIWSYVEDVETADDSLVYRFYDIDSTLNYGYNNANGNVIISANDTLFSGSVIMHIEVEDDSSAGAEDSITVIVAPINGITNPFAGQIPKEYILMQNYPNPFNPATHIRFGLPKASHVKITIYNILGEHVALLVDEWKKTGYHTIEWDGTTDAGEKVSSGVYLYQFLSKDFHQVRKMMFLK